MILSPILPIVLIAPICLAVLIFIIVSAKKEPLKNIKTFLPKILIILLAFLINIRPMFPDSQGKTITNNLDVLFVVDTTISMNAEDYNGKNTRLSGVKNDLKYIINELAGARFSLISFNNQANVLSPYTRDENMIKESIDILKPIDTFYAKGTSLNVPFDETLNSLKSSKKKADRVQILFYVSDGEYNGKDTLKSFSELKSYVSSGAVLGYGTERGGEMRTISSLSEKEEYVTVRDYKSPDYGKNAISKIDESTLKKIASDVGINYIRMESQSSIKDTLKEIKNLRNENISEDAKNGYIDIYYIFVIPLLVLLVIEFEKIWRKTL